ncbi:MAG: phosphotransferase family protein [Clostridia bacterium]
MPDPLSPDLVQARAYLSHRYRTPLSDLTLVGAGEWSRAYGFCLEGEEVVARFGPYREDFEKDALMARIPHAGVPIPRVLDAASTPWGRMQVAERVHGRFLDDLDDPSLRQVLPHLLSVLDDLAAVVVPGQRGYGLFDPEGRAPHSSWPEALLSAGEDDPARRVHGWRDRLAASATGSGPFDRAFGVLQSLARDLPDAVHIIHQDLLHRNVFVTRAQVCGVIDWGNALFGDFLYDWAFILYWLPFTPGGRALDARALFSRHWEQTGRVPEQADARLLAYQIHIGLEAQAYNAFQGRFDEVARYAAHTLALLGERG